MSESLNLTKPLQDAIAEAEELIANAPFIRTEQDRLEGYDYLSGRIRMAMQMAFDYDLDRPIFINPTHQFSRQGLDNPDAVYFNAYLREGVEYVVRGRRGTSADLSFQVMGGTYSADSAATSLMAFDDRELDIADDGTFEFTYVAEPGAKTMIVREVFNDWDTEERGTLTIERPDTIHQPAKPLTEKLLARKYEVAARSLVGSIQTWFAFPQFFQYKEPVNTLTAPQSTPGGLASQRSSIGHYELADDEAMIVTVPECTDCSYQGIQIGSDWYASTDYETHQTSLTKAQAVTDPDGKMRFVISEEQPGHRQLARDHRPPHRLDDAALAAARARPDPGGGRPDDRDRAVRRRTAAPAALHPPHPRGVRRAHRRPAALRCPKDDQLMSELGYAEAHDTSIEERYQPVPLLQGKVIVISGIGPGLGPVAGRGGRQDGRRPGDRQPHRVAAPRAPGRAGGTYGGKVVSVVTDVTDEDSRVNLRDKTLEAFGRVDCVINNAFTIPPMDPITQIEPRKLAKVNETNVFAPLRLSALFADALSESQGLDHHAQLLRRLQLPARVRRLQAVEGRARAPRLVARHRAGPARHPGQQRGAVVHLRGRQPRLLRLPRRRGGQDPRGDLRRQGRPDRPQAARVVGGGRPRDALPGQRPRLRRHRPDADRGLR